MSARALLLAVMASLVAITAAACGSGEERLDSGRDADPDSTAQCERDLDCSTPAEFCVIRRCRPTAEGADSRGCVDDGSPCPDGVACDEENDRCGTMTSCFEIVEDCIAPGDCDGDGSQALECGGNDCDDTDALRFPGGAEVCDADHRDEDCDPTTFGGLDDDRDGVESAECCNGGSCGGDCDDTRRDVFPGADETCNASDDDCDGAIDEAGAYCPVGICRETRCEAANWERVYRTPGSIVTWTTVGPDGGVFVAVSTGDDLDGDGSGESDQSYIVAYGPEGRYRWHRPFEGQVTVGPAGELIALTDVAGASHFQRIDSSDGTVTAMQPVPFPAGWSGTASWLEAVGEDVYVASISVAGGERRLLLMRVDASLASRRATLEFRGVGTDGFQGENRPFVLAASRAGVALGTSFGAPQTVSGMSVPAGRLVALISPELSVAWTRALHGVVYPDGLAVSNDGDLALSGHYEGAFAPAWGDPWPSPAGGSGAFATVFAADGSERWTSRHDGPAIDVYWDVSFDERGGVMITGSFSGEMDVTPLGSLRVASGDSSDGVVVVRAVPDSFPTLARQLRGAGAASATSATVDAFGGLVAGGIYWQDVELVTGTSYPGSSVNRAFVFRVSTF